MRRLRTCHGRAALAVAAAALAACGQVDVPADPDGTPPGSDIDARPPGPDIDARVVDAAPLPDAPPPECREGVTQLLFNGGFEEADQGGAFGWVEDAAPGDHLTYPEDQLGGFDVMEGNRAAWMGRAIPSDQRLSQRVTIPDTTTALDVEMLRCFVTLETTKTEEFDVLTIALLDTNGTELEQLARFTNLEIQDTCSWTEIKLDAAAPHAGEELELEFHVVTDQGSQTSFFLDAVSLNATGPCPDAG